jgi:hypothetical protein
LGITRKIESDTVLQLDWSPDEKQIAVSRIDLLAASPALSTDVINFDTGKETRLSSIPIGSMQELEALAFLRHVVWTR